jgi:hypothetical protein
MMRTSVATSRISRSTIATRVSRRQLSSEVSPFGTQNGWYLRFFALSFRLLELMVSGYHAGMLGTIR